MRMKTSEFILILLVVNGLGDSGIAIILNQIMWIPLIWLLVIGLGVIIDYLDLIYEELKQANKLKKNTDVK